MVPLPDTIKIFPLSEVVLFPDTLLPLHIFELRYRKMLQDAMEGDRLIGMTLVSGAGVDGVPEVFSIGCAGRVVESEQLPDGRSLIILQGTVKFRIREELTVDLPYRKVKAQALYEAPPTIDCVRRWRDELRGPVEALLRASGADEIGAARAVENLDSVAAVNYLSAVMPLSVIDKQSLLECPTVEKRYERLRSLLEFKVAELRLGMDSGNSLGN